MFSNIKSDCTVCLLDYPIRFVNPLQAVIHVYVFNGGEGLRTFYLFN